MKRLLPVVLLLALLTILFLSACEYNGEGTGFSQQDLELQRKNSERQRGF